MQIFREVFGASGINACAAQELPVTDFTLLPGAGPNMFCVTLDEAAAKFRKITLGIFDGFDWTGCAAAGGSVLRSIIVSERGFESSDVDVFVSSEVIKERAEWLQKKMEQHDSSMERMRRNGRGRRAGGELVKGVTRTVQRFQGESGTLYAITLRLNHNIFFKLQLISVGEFPPFVMSGLEERFDLDCCCVYYAFDILYFGDRGSRAISMALSGSPFTNDVFVFRGRSVYCEDSSVSFTAEQWSERRAAKVLARALKYCARGFGTRIGLNAFNRAAFFFASE